VKTAVKTVLYSVFLGLVIWSVDGLFYWRFGPPDSLTEALFPTEHPHRLYLRGLVLLSLVVYGWIMGALTMREERAAQELAQMTHRLELILGSAHEGIFGLDLAGRFTFVSSATASMLGYDVEEMLGWDSHTLIHHSYPDGEPYLRDDCAILNAHGSDEPPRETSEVLWRKDGEPVPVRYTARPIWDNGQCRGTVVVLRRVSQDEPSQEELERLRRLSRLILTWAGEGIFGIDLDGRITFANPAASVMLGYDTDELVGRRSHPLIQHTDQDGGPHREEQSLIYAAFKDNDVYHVSDEVFWRKGGESFPVEYTSTPLRENGDVVGAVVVFKDITERKNAERELRQTLEELARSNRELEQFAYVVSHDLQEPLRMVRSYVELLGKRYADRLDEDGREFVGYAIDGATRMQRMIEDLLRYSRVGSRGAEFVLTDLSDVVEEALSNLTAAIEEAGARIEYGDMPSLWVDRAQMVQLFQNLISNAIKFRAERTPEVTVAAHPRNGEWVFAVSDNGIGIAEEQRERIFAIFQRLHADDEYPGTGIGLAICKKIVERHGGSIWVESRPGEGSTFYFALPAEASAARVRR